MTALHIILSVLQLIVGLSVTSIVLMQSGKSAGLSGTISGGAETFLSKGKAKTWDEKLAKMTPWLAGAFIVLTFILHFV
ncbi:MAG: preprotein translocase subunit SecG [Oscillospiraceae bacterium]|nr:preprotein translocase subunit SecG [Oscillospiraceae bacterium]